MKLTDEMRTKIEAAIRKHPNHGNSKIRDTFRNKSRPNPVTSAAVVAEVRAGMEGGTVVPAKGQSNKTGRSLSDFRNTYDVDTIIPAKVKTALKELGASWEYESEFVKRAGVSYSDLGNYRDAFADHVVIVRKDHKRVWAGTVAFANQLREML